MMALSTLYAELGVSLYQPRVFNAATRLKFFQRRARLLVDSLDHSPPSPFELILIQRILEAEWLLIKQDHRLKKGEELTPWAEKNRMWHENRLRLSLRALAKYPAEVPRGRPKLEAGSKYPPEFEAMLAKLRAEEEQDGDGMAP